MSSLDDFGKAVKNLKRNLRGLRQGLFIMAILGVITLGGIVAWLILLPK